MKGHGSNLHSLLMFRRTTEPPLQTLISEVHLLNVGQGLKLQRREEFLRTNEPPAQTKTSLVH
jgi:hypothetical protein